MKSSLFVSLWFLLSWKEIVIWQRKEMGKKKKGIKRNKKKKRREDQSFFQARSSCEWWGHTTAVTEHHQFRTLYLWGAGKCRRQAEINLVTPSLQQHSSAACKTLPFLRGWVTCAFGGGSTVGALAAAPLHKCLAAWDMWAWHLGEKTHPKKSKEGLWSTDN